MQRAAQQEEAEMDQKVSVIIPVYNAEPYLDACIRSVLHQTWQNVEVILINDGSRDGSLAICRRYEAEDPRVVVLDQENQGVSAARNNGLRHATGQWLSFLDADDWLDENTFAFALEKQAELNADVVVWNRSEDYPSRQVLCKFAQDTVYAAGEAQMEAFRYRALTCQTENGVHEIGTCNIVARIIRRSIIEENGLRFEQKLKNNEDILFMLEVFEHVDSVYMENRFYYHRSMHEDSAIARFNPRILSNSALTSEHYFRFLDKHHKPQKYYDFCGGLHVFWAMQCFSLGIFHPDNKDSLGEKIRTFRTLITGTPFKEVFARKPGNIARFKKLYFFLAKHECILLLILLSLLYKKTKE